MNSVRIFRGQPPDQFVAGFAGPQAVHLFRWVDTAANGGLDFIVGTAGVNSIPDRATGLLMLNTGPDERLKSARPEPLRDSEGAINQPGGAHKTGALGTMLGGAGPNLLVCHKAGRLFLIPRRILRTTP